MGEGRRVLVAGVASPSSVGVAIAAELCRRGARVWCTAAPHRAEACREVLAGLDVELVELDPRDTDAFGERLAGLDVLDAVIHAQVLAPPEVLARRFTEVGSQDFARVMTGSVHSLVALCGATREALCRGREPRVLTLSSTLAERVAPRYHVAGVAKAALEASVRYLAAELGRDGILCNALRFSLVATDGARGALGEAACEGTRAYVARRALDRRPLELDAVVQAARWLTSSEATLTGQVLTVDGGEALAY